MAVFRLCSVKGCRNRLHGRSYCCSHYSRWRRHGDPLAGIRYRGEIERFLRDVVLPYEGSECLLWPFPHNGNGYARYEVARQSGGRDYVHRIVCDHFNGPPPTPDHEAAHKCGRGHEGCVAGRHLRWATHAENMADTLAHGTRARGERNGHAKLTEENVRFILAMRGKMMQKELAAMFGVSRITVCDVQRGRRWRHVSSPSPSSDLVDSAA